jgi:large subunit ribosomal protein L15
MNLHSLKNTAGASHRRMRVGRGIGSGKGKTSGRGHKGQFARSGHKHKPGFEGGQMRFARRMPKRGFTNVNGKSFVPVNVGDLARFDDGAEITLDGLRAAGLAKGVKDGVKILGAGEIAKKLIVKAQAFSASARAKIESAGGICEVVQATAKALAR